MISTEVPAAINHRRESGRIPKAILSVVLALAALNVVYALFARRFVYLPFAIGFLVIVAAAFCLKPEWRARFALLLFSSVLALYLAEFAITIVTPMFSAKNVWKAHRTFDFRTREEVIRDFRSHGAEAYQRVAAGFPIAGPGITLGGSVSNTTIVWCNETGHYSVYQSDEHGFRNPAGIWNAKQLQIAAVGDSFTNGACVDSGRDFVSLIRAEHPATLNLGSGGAGPLEMLAALQEYAMPLRPQIVLWCFFEGNDLDDLRRESKNPILMRYLRENDFRQNLAGRQVEIDQVMRPTLEGGIQNKLSVLLIPSIGLRYYGTKSIVRFVTLHETHSLLQQVFKIGVKKDSWKAEENQIGLLREILTKAASQVSNANGQLYFVFLPGTELMKNNPGRMQLRNEVLQMVGETGIPTIDIYTAFHSVPDPLSLYSVPFPHFNENGYKLTAQVIEHTLSSAAQTASNR